MHVFEVIFDYVFLQAIQMELVMSCTVENCLMSGVNSVCNRALQKNSMLIPRTKTLYFPDGQRLTFDLLLNIAQEKGFEGRFVKCIPHYVGIRGSPRI